MKKLFKKEEVFTIKEQQLVVEDVIAEGKYIVYVSYRSAQYYSMMLKLFKCGHAELLKWVELSSPDYIYLIYNNMPVLSVY